ncbi:hypothetical protein GCM10018772_70640 [Streptomyces fumanus]|uniref:Uncharacterized protein n=1 Tax=Streptomyces fumanus TaxID=67302 RepID=A0A919B1Y4_9ACTN|nr:hypothetical protein GCM10018772_70640 [Streptomyces fumanus]
MNGPAAPAAESTRPYPGQLELFRVQVRSHLTIDYVRPDGGPLTSADFDRLARVARAALTREGDCP